jgi:protocatechuate 3,4-dioxygenase beta subunit
VKITDANGNYLFTDLVPGSYTITIDSATLPVNAHPSYELDGSMNGSIAITLISGDKITNVDFGYYVGASVGDYVWIDTNRDGIQQDTESGMANVTVRLYSSSGILIGETKTDASGKYTFNDLTPGEYYITFVSPSNYIFSPANKGLNTYQDSNPDAAGQTAGFTLVSRSQNMTIDAGLLRVTSVSGTIIDKDGKPVPGAVVVITDAAGTTIGTTTTDVKGVFIIRNLVPDQVITITVTKPGFTTMVLSAALADTDIGIGNQMLVKRIVKTGEANSENSLCAAILLLSGMSILFTLRRRRKTKSE